MSDLRDHSKPCEHGLDGVHATNEREVDDGVTLVDWCPGGAVVTIDYEAATQAYLDDDMHGDLDLIALCARKVVDAALGGVDE